MTRSLRTNRAANPLLFTFTFPLRVLTMFLLALLFGALPGCNREPEGRGPQSGTLPPTLAGMETARILPASDRQYDVARRFRLPLRE